MKKLTFALTADFILSLISIVLSGNTAAVDYPLGKTTLTNGNNQLIHCGVL
jgi:hypothetical protein